MKDSGVLGVLLAIFCFSGPVFGVLSGGGTAANPYLIQSRADFDEFADPANAAVYWASGVYTKLMCNLDLSDTTYAQAVIAPDTFDGISFEGAPFIGNFDGNGHIISNLTIAASTNDYIGLFGNVGSGGQVKNLGIENVNLTGDFRVGGLVGYNSYGLLTSCYATGSVSGTKDVGGLVGYNRIGTLTSCYATSSANGTDCNVGGLVGYNAYGVLTFCYSTGLVNGQSAVGGLVGYNLYDAITSGTLISCFWDKQTSGTSNGVGSVDVDPNPIGVTGKNTSEMQTLSTFTNAGWLFISGTATFGDWVMPANGYPKLAWEVYSPVTIPTLKGLTEEQAKDVLEAAGLLSGESYSVYDVSIAVGLISETYPGSGTVVYAGLTPVHLLLANDTRYSSGDGITVPYQIAHPGDWIDLMNTPTDWDKSFVLTTNINLASHTFTHAAIGWGTPFTGVFDGNGHVISNLTINQPTKDYVGLFGSIGSGGHIKKLAVEHIFIVGHNFVGGLAGYTNGSITGCYATGSVNGNSNVGGLAGRNYGGSLTDCFATCSVRGFSDVGGLVGYNGGSLTGCYATGLVSGSSTVGGLVGVNQSSITACFWDVQTSTQNVGFGAGYSEGVVGKTTAEMKTLSTFSEAGWCISDMDGFDADWIISSDGQDYPQTICFAYRDPSDTVPLSGEGTEQNPYQVGSPADLVSLSQYSSVWDKHIVLTDNVDMSGVAIRPIGNSRVRFTGCFNGQDFAICNITMNFPNKDNVGVFGFVGSGGTITNLSIEDANSIGKYYVGGLVGYNSKGTISNCHSSGWAAGNSSSTVGGLIGINFGGTILNCSSSASVSGLGATLGGLVGSNFTRGTILNSSASGVITDNDPDTFGSCVGGLVGNNFNSTITNCSATGDVSVTSASSSASAYWIGGLVGENRDSAISNCYATGNVHVISASSSAPLCGGGLSGLNNDGKVNDCYAKGSVTFTCTTEFNYFFGGLLGLNVKGSVNRCYSNGMIGSGASAEADCCVGGFCGFNMDGDVYGCFWDIEVGTKVLSGGGRGLTTEQMKTLSTYQDAGWADKGWVIEDGQDYPRLAREGTNGVAIPVSSAVELIGNGTAENPYQIWTAQDFEIWMQYASVLNKHTRLKADLDLNGVLLYPIGEYGPFTGTFDGNRHVIRNVTILQPTNSYVGLFGRVGAGGVITDLGIQDIDIVGGDYVGGLIGKNEGGTISNCYSSGTTRGLAYIGGLIGSNECGTVNHCYSDVIITAWDSTFDSYAGGLAGYNGSGTLTSCYATGSVNGAGSTVGGLAGENHGTLTACYATGFVAGTSLTGGLVGWNQGTLNRCFWDTQISGKTVGVGYGTSTGVTGKTTTEMKTLSTFASMGWDFSNTDGDPADWMMLREWEDYPRLAWQPIIAGDIAGLYGVDIEDLDAFVQQWLMENCSSVNDFCNGADINSSGYVDLTDFVVLASHWSPLIDVTLQGYWKLDEATESTAPDSSEYLRDGTLMNGPVWTPSGKLKGALEFDGVNDYVEIVDYKGVTGLSSRTCMAWIKTTKASGEILSWGNSNTGSKWIVRVNETGALRAEVQGGYLYGDAPINDGDWHHIAVVLNSDGTPKISEVLLYVDGQQETVAGVFDTYIDTAADQNVVIGVYTKATGRFFKGLMDDVRIYNKALSDAEIRHIFEMEETDL